MRKLANQLLDLFFPPRCPFCRRLLKDYEHDLCRACRGDLPWTRGSSQVQRFRHVESCASALYYEGKVRQSLIRFKFNSLRAYAPEYAALMARLLHEQHISFDVITWVPVSAARLRKRGYDQAQLLAEEISRSISIPCMRLLEKTTDNPAQSSISSAAQRQKNVAGVYRVTEIRAVKGRSILLVDDIVTTGATLNECARVLKTGGAAAVSAVTLARSRKE